MIKFIKNKYQERQLAKILSQPRDKRIENWNNIKTIGLIFTAGDAQHWNLIHRFITAQENRGKQVYVIGFHAANVVIDYIFSHTKTTICREKEDFNYFGLPKEGVVDAFLANHYDILIDSTVQPDFFGKYISAMADADLKINYSVADSDIGITDMYDMAIQGKEPMDFKDYIEQIVKYLSLIQK